MRVIECNQCGQVLQADSDEQLVELMRGHVSAEHGDAGVDDAAVREMVEREAYDATDA